MVFLILNVIIALALTVSSFAIDSKNSASKDGNPLVNTVLFLAALFVMMAVTIGFCLYAPQKLAFTVGKLTYLLMAWFCVNNAVYVVCFPEYKRHKIGYVVQWLLNIIAFVIIFFVRGGISNISITADNSYQLTSNLMFTGRLGRALMVTWFVFYEGFFVFFVPLIACIMVLVKAENMKSTLYQQKFLLNIVGVLSSMVIFLFIKVSAIYQPMLSTLLFVCFIPEMLAFMYAEKVNELWDRKIVFRMALKFIVKYLFPSLLLGEFFTLTWPMYNRIPILFFIFFILETIVLIAVWHIAGMYITKKGWMRDTRYEEDFARELATINFNDEPKEITAKLFEVFHTYVDSSSLKILVDSGDNYLQCVYDSAESDEEKTLSRTFEMNGEMFDKLFNLNRHIVFRENMMAARDHSLTSVKRAVLEFLDELESDAFILLSEGRHLTGLIMLGKKGSNNVYNDYDSRVFTNLYSNFFVIGYYMKNIMNESVVGTVNREIKMAGQIITSIQENMDRVKLSKVDVGYLMHPAHNIGGEFVDIIRLTDSRYIYIIGSLSGKGIAASMNMVILKSIIRTFLSETTDFKMLVVKVNSFIRESLPKGTIFSGIFSLMDFSTDTMYYINCGAPALLLYTRAYNNIIEIQGDGHILGFAKDLTDVVKVKKVRLAPGDIVFACTDGLVNTKSLRGERFGKARIQNELLDNRSYPTERVTQFMYDALVRFASSELDDDVTIFMMKYLALEGGLVK
ncbi:MAG: serine/threonine-protein phosphatase [Treponema sp.]|nr:serine/threonine-protein phosphatase [Treponema sp.]